MEIDLVDKYALLDGSASGTLETTYNIAAGTNIVTAVQSIFAEAGEVKTPIIAPTSITTPYELIKEAGSTFSELLEELANMISWVCYYDNDGYPRFEPPSDLDSDASVWSFDATDTGETVLLSSDADYPFSKFYNNVVVIGDSVNGITYRAVATDTSTGNGTSVAELGVKVTKVIEDSLIYSTPLAQERADAELAIAVLSSESVDLSTVHVDILEGDDIITLKNTELGIDTVRRYKVESISFPLFVTGEMGVSASRERVLM